MTILILLIKRIGSANSREMWPICMVRDMSVDSFLKFIMYIQEHPVGSKILVEKQHRRLVIM